MCRSVITGKSVARDHPNVSIIHVGNAVVVEGPGRFNKFINRMIR